MRGWQPRDSPWSCVWEAAWGECVLVAEEGRAGDVPRVLGIGSDSERLLPLKDRSVDRLWWACPHRAWCRSVVGTGIPGLWEVGYPVGPS